MHLFEKVGRKSNCDNEGNLGRASCLYGLAQLKFKNMHNGIDETSCLKEVASLLEMSIEIYKRRNHMGGAAHCLQQLAMIKKKLNQPNLHLSK